MVNSRDVTERKRAQAELDELRRRHSDELEARVRIRTAELAHKNEELKAANEATDQAMKLQEVFLSNVAHDLRTPLTIVIGYSEDLLRRAKKKGQDAFIPDLNLIVNKGKDLLELINDLLNLSKAMNEKGVELDLRRFEVAPMIRSRMEGIGAIAQKQGNTIDLRLDPRPRRDVRRRVEALADPDEPPDQRLQVHQGRARSPSTPTGSAAESGDRLVFRVVDTGMGMGPEQRPGCSTGSRRSTPPAARCRPASAWGCRSASSTAGRWAGRSPSRARSAGGTTFRVELPAEVEEKPAATPDPRRPRGRPSSPPRRPARRPGRPRSGRTSC